MQRVGDIRLHAELGGLHLAAYHNEQQGAMDHGAGTRHVPVPVLHRSGAHQRGLGALHLSGARGLSSATEEYRKGDNPHGNEGLDPLPEAPGPAGRKALTSGVKED
ncbi:hypothetical protein SDC9_12241 [bioreactor metagenome]|uniref:Uncharacterized protein n=1 Tax=bioreactor metagenome TaxID=1076179 RepID=A0A644TJF9_9ZZZZ|nr:hypothetical protein TRIP_E360003 [uncultured Spirochaetota bacterium]